jgi:tetratricopeptide (TPR) repeat protein
MSSILTKEPAPLARYASEVPDELQRIVRKSLSKDKEGRYQGIKDLLIDLRELKQDVEFEAKLERSIEPVVGDRSTTPERPEIGGRAEAKTAPQRTVRTGESSATSTTSSSRIVIGEIRRHKLGVSLTLAALVIAAVAAYFYFHRQPVLTDKDTILIADFVNTTGDADLDGTLKTGLAVQLEQSPFLLIFSDERVRETLRYMERSPDERVTKGIAREICQRQGIKALLAGTVSNLGRHYVISLEAINAQSGDVIARQQTQADNKEQVLGALGQAAAKLREKLGESLTSIQKFDAPIEQGTTSSLEALKAFSVGCELLLASKIREAIPSLKRAVELDPNFALAYYELEVAYRNTRQLGMAAEYAQKAFELRERVSEREKLLISLSYYTSVTRELDKQVEVAEALRRDYPRNYQHPNSLSIRYRELGQYEKAVETAREAIRLNPDWVPPQSNLAFALIRLNRFEEAKEIYESAQRTLDSSTYHSRLYEIGFVHGDTAAMKQQVDWAAGKPDEYAAFEWQAHTAMFAGRLREARELIRRAIDLAQSRNLIDVAAPLSSASALYGATVGHCQEIRSALALARGVSAARALALCGDIVEAQSRADELAARFPKGTVTNAVDLPMIRAAFELHRRDSDKAIQLLQPANHFEGTGGFWAVYLRGQAYLLKRSGTEAAVEFQRILDHRGWDPTSYLYPLAHLGLGRAYAVQGDSGKARKAYQDFLALWKDADADLPILIEAKKEYASLK